jgi:hypothetical protein
VTAVGYRLAAAAELVMTGKLSKDARLTLACMALHAHDDTALYWLGQEWIAVHWLGCDAWDDAAGRRARRAIAELVAAGLVLPVGWREGRSPHRVYALVLPTGPRRKRR